MIIPEVPNTGIDHAKSAHCHYGPDSRTRNDIVPVVKLVNSKSATDQLRPQDRDIGNDELPISGVMITPDFEFSIEVQIQVHKARERRCRMTGRERFQGIVDFVLISRAPRAVVHDSVEAVAAGSAIPRDLRLADGEEVRP